MSFNPTQALSRQVTHSTQMAMEPGWWAYTQHQVKTTEAELQSQGLWVGLHTQVAAGVKATGFKPAKDELGDWWTCPALGMVDTPVSNKKNWRR